MDKNYKEIDFSLGTNITEAVLELIEYRNKGVLACGEFNGVTLYSDTVTMDGAYMEILGKTKDGFDDSQRKWREDYDREEKEYKESIPILTDYWMDAGRKVLTADKWDRWDEIVPIRLGDLYRGMELGNCLDIVKILNSNGTLDEAKKTIEDQGHSGMSYSLVCGMVKEFCDRGEEFVKYVG